MKYRRIVKFEMTTEEFLHVGETRGTNIGEVDLPLIKIGSKPIIPGSSLKGAFRAEFTRVLSSIQQEKLKQLIGYTLVATPKETVNNMTSEIKTDDVVKIIQDSIKSPENAKVGIIDLLLGCEFFASPTFFTDALPLEEKDLVRERIHIKIDQDTDVAKSGALVDLEAVYPGKKFEFRIFYNSLVFYDGDNENPVDKAFDLLVKFINGREMFIGGWKSRGYGLVKIEKKEDVTLSLEKLIGVNS